MSEWLAQHSVCATGRTGAAQHLPVDHDCGLIVSTAAYLVDPKPGAGLAGVSRSLAVCSLQCYCNWLLSHTRVAYYGCFYQYLNMVR